MLLYVDGYEQLETHVWLMRSVKDNRWYQTVPRNRNSWRSVSFIKQLRVKPRLLTVRLVGYYMLRVYLFRMGIVSNPITSFYDDENETGEHVSSH